MERLFIFFKVVTILKDINWNSPVFYVPTKRSKV